MKFPWIKNTQGEPSASLTMATAAFFVVTAWLVAWIVCTPLEIVIPPFDVASAMGFLSPLLMLYFGRRWTSKNGKIDAEGEGEIAATPKSAKE